MEFLELEIYKHYQEVIKKQGVYPKSTKPLVKPYKINFYELLEKYDVFCFDGYGTLYNKGEFTYSGAKEWIKELRLLNKQIRLVTNAASNNENILAKEAFLRGFDFLPFETISSGGLLKNWLDKNVFNFERIHEVYYIGRTTGINVLRECGIELNRYPKIPVVAVSSSTATIQEYRQALNILRKKNSLLLVLNPDAWAPEIDGSRIPVSGALCEKLRRDSICAENDFEGCKVKYFGKPFSEIWDKVKTTIPSSAKSIMIGDTLGTDILGAYVSGFDSALIVGRNEPFLELSDDEKELGVIPTYYLM